MVSHRPLRRSCFSRWVMPSPSLSSKDAASRRRISAPSIPAASLAQACGSSATIMHVGDRLPLVSLGATMGEAIAVVSGQGFGCVAVIDEAGFLAGIVTDGDIRRHLGDGLLSTGRSRQSLTSPSEDDAAGCAARQRDRNAEFRKRSGAHRRRGRFCPVYSQN